MSSTTAGLSILIVDDHADNRRLQRISLEGARFTVDDVASGPEALEYLKAKRPDIVLLDVSMPEMSGLETLQLIRGNPTTADLKVILVTAMATKNDEDLGYASGADAYVTKPCTPTHLRAAVEQMLAAGPRPGAKNE